VFFALIMSIKVFEPLAMINGISITLSPNLGNGLEIQPVIKSRKM